MFWLDVDFSGIWDLCRGHPELEYVWRKRCGGMLRSPTVFEDIIKTVCTTNCDWRNTKQMCESLCNLADGAFPEPATILKIPISKLQIKTSVGYRARTIKTIAQLWVDGMLPIEDWAKAKDYQKIRTHLQQIWGIGEYSINHILVLLGDFSRIPVDSEVLKYLRQTHFDGADVDSKKAVLPYQPFGEYQYLAYKYSRIARKMNYINK